MNTTTHSPALHASGLTKKFGDLTAVDHVDLTVHRGEIVALLGHNGAGKTTLLDMALGFAVPEAGAIEVFGKHPSVAAAAGDIGAVLQERGLLKDLTVAETARMIADCHHHPRNVDEVLERAGATDFADRKVGKCSGGQVQRLRFALSLLTDPDLLILDEPTAGLDATARREFWRTMHSEAAHGRTIIFATHYLHEADEFAERVVLMDRGSIISDGRLSDLVADRGRTITGTWTSEQDPRTFAAETVSVDGDTVSFVTHDADSLTCELLSKRLIRDITIARPGLEEIFFGLNDAAKE
ncbi:ABC transporter ATP-binding protein [Corynebacterium sp. TAE3-ERU12]|uniref:ABC transporter ATP-binding protein n=1 Tax=Corynebacterium sp. TAE3-ERU12 TaxID=2849491 RepID=UPI001C479AF7|nr:ABC transporter ATP-binding protein [Corynebacterium sp. TAE3-ERU12]MBV7295554.1 ABC transporter ATP-binding protein [Corynebacterium sp. TAE3-ERU12]